MKRVAAYCRVSTDQRDQKNSLQNQEAFFRSYISQHPLWVLAEIYVDEGITGTSTKKREAFCRMMQDAYAGQFDLLLTKEISRFARNTLDSIYYTRQLKSLGIGVVFITDNINTLDPDAELRLAILSSIAQEESRKTSERVKWGQKRRMEQGVVFGRRLLGFELTHGQLSIHPEEAKTVQLIFHKFVYEGKGSHTIARELEEAAVPTSPYMKRWTGSSILRILRNEKYCGDLVQKKTITPDYLTHEKKCNLGQEDLIVMRDHHQAIISRQLFEAAQQKLNQTSPPLNQKRQYSNRYCFSGKIVCGHCGSHYVSRTKNRKDHTTYRIWRCHRRTVYGSTAEHSSQAALCCDNPSLNDHALRLALQHVFQHLVFNRPQLVSQLSQAVQSAISLDAPVPTTVHKAHCHTISAIQKKRQILLEMYHHQEITASELEQALVRYDGQIQAFSKNMPSLSQPSVFAQITSHITDLIENFTWDETFYRCLLDHITVKPNGLVEIHFLHLPCAFSFQLTRSP